MSLLGQPIVDWELFDWVPWQMSWGETSLNLAVFAGRGGHVSVCKHIRNKALSQLVAYMKTKKSPHTCFQY